VRAFGLDADNTVIVDNVRLVRLQDGLPPLTISQMPQCGDNLDPGGENPERD
jgi:hypothetical protein